MFRTIQLICYLVLLVAGAVGCAPGRDEVGPWIRNSKLIYVCEKVGEKFIVRSILKNSTESPLTVVVGESPEILNYRTMDTKIIREPLILVVFVESKEMIKQTGINAGQTEIPLDDNGYLTGHGISLAEIPRLIASSAEEKR